MITSLLQFTWASPKMQVSFFFGQTFSLVLKIVGQTLFKIENFVNCSVFESGLSPRQILVMKATIYYISVKCRSEMLCSDSQNKNIIKMTGEDRFKIVCHSGSKNLMSLWLRPRKSSVNLTIFFHMHKL